MDINPEVLNCLFLLPTALYDHRKREVPVLPCILYAIAGQVLRFARGEGHAGAVALWIGLFCLLLVLPDPEGGAVGTGDLMVLTACASAAGILHTLETVFFAAASAAGYALYLKVFRKAGLREAFPFVPFLFCAQVLVVLIAGHT